jgi:DNA-binding response OmpR family regulator
MNQLLETPCDEAAQPARNQSNQPHRILVAKDDRKLRQINTMVLTCAGYAVGKPYTIDQLLDTVRAVLHASNRAPGNSSHDQTGETSHQSRVRLTSPQPEHLCRG